MLGDMLTKRSHEPFFVPHGDFQFFVQPVESAVVLGVQRFN